MNPALAIQLIGILVQSAPEIVAELRVLFTKGDPTKADWDALELQVGKSYDAYIREATLEANRPGSTLPVPPS